MPVASTVIPIGLRPPARLWRLVVPLGVIFVTLLEPRLAV